MMCRMKELHEPSHILVPGTFCTAVPNSSAYQGTYRTYIIIRSETSKIRTDERAQTEQQRENVRVDCRPESTVVL